MLQSAGASSACLGLDSPAPHTLPLPLPAPAAANAKIPCVGGHPRNIIMLACDAYGVLPPVAKLTKEQAM